MPSYEIIPDMKNFNNSLFTWYLIYSNMYQHFFSIADILWEYNEKGKPKDRVYNFIMRVGFGYTSEAQKVIKLFIGSTDYSKFEELLSTDDKENFNDLNKQWENFNNGKEYTYINELRNEIFHFNASANEESIYIKRFANYYNKYDSQSPKLLFDDFQKHNRYYHDNKFCDILWWYTISQDHTKNSDLKELLSANDSYSKENLHIQIAKVIQLCLDSIMPVHTILEEYFINRGIIKMI